MRRTFSIFYVVQKLFLSCERNAQLLLHSGLVRVLWSDLCCDAIGRVSSITLAVTHPSVDKLSNHRIEVRDLRVYLRLGSQHIVCLKEDDAINQYFPTGDRWRLVLTLGLVDLHMAMLQVRGMIRDPKLVTSCPTHHRIPSACRLKLGPFL